MDKSPYFEDSEFYLSSREEPYQWPEVIQFELIALCNLRCIMCPLTLVGHTRSKYKMYSLDDLQKMREIFEHAYEIELTGFGEALLHPQIIEVLRFFKGCELCVHLTTNGLLLTIEKADAIVQEGLVDVVRVSMDAARAETYAQIRRGGDFEKLLNNLKYFMGLKRKLVKSKPPLHLLFIAMRHNIEELPEFPQIAQEVGADLVVVQEVDEVWARSKLQLTPEDFDMVKNSFVRAKQEATRLGIPIEFCWQSFNPVELGVDVDGVKVRSYQFSRPPDPDRPFIKDCPFLWDRVFIKVNRDVQICATLWEEGIVGNLENNSLHEIWHSERYKKIRRQMAGTNPIAECYDCPTKSCVRPHLESEIPSSIDFGNQLISPVGLGFYLPERDECGRAYRWMRREATFFLRREKEHNFLKLEVGVHPLWSDLKGVLLLNEKSVAEFDCSQARGGELMFDLPKEPLGPVKFTIKFDKQVHPRQMGIASDYRALTVRLYRAELFSAGAGDEFEFSDENAPIVSGWYQAERGGASNVRWSFSNAKFLVPSNRKFLVFWFARFPAQPPQKIKFTVGYWLKSFGPYRRQGLFPIVVPLPKAESDFHKVSIEATPAWLPAKMSSEFKDDTRELGVAAVKAIVTDKVGFRTKIRALRALV